MPSTTLSGTRFDRSLPTCTIPPIASNTRASAAWPRCRTIRSRRYRWTSFTRDSSLKATPVADPEPKYGRPSKRLFSYRWLLRICLRGSCARLASRIRCADRGQLEFPGWLQNVWSSGSGSRPDSNGRSRIRRPNLEDLGLQGTVRCEHYEDGELILTVRHRDGWAYNNPEPTAGPW